MSSKQYLQLPTEIVHDKVRVHKCDFCNKTFGLKRVLQRHIDTVHCLKKHLECESCSKTFTHKDTHRWARVLGQEGGRHRGVS